MTSTGSTELEEVFSFTLEQRASNVIVQRIFGLSPYIVITPDLDEDEQKVLFNIEVGGGAELEGLGELLEGLGHLLSQPEAAQQIEAAQEAAREAAEQDEDDD